MGTPARRCGLLLPVLAPLVASCGAKFGDVYDIANSDGYVPDDSAESVAEGLSGKLTFKVLGSGKCADVGAGSMAGAHVRQWPCHGSTEQQWRVENVATGIYNFISVSSGMCWDVEGAATSSSAKIIQSSCNGSLSQRFRVSSVDGGFQMQAMHSGKCVDVQGASLDDGAEFQQYGCHGGSNQTFTLGSPSTATSGGGSTDGVDGGAAIIVGAGGDKTTCLNADGAGGKDTDSLIESVLGSAAVEHNPDSDHNPPFRHVKEDTDSEVGNHFVFYAHYPIDSDGSPTDDRSRIEIKVNNGAANELKGTPGKIMTYTWRFKMTAQMGFSERFTHMFQMKSFGGNAGAPIITLTGTGTGSGENLRVEYRGEKDGRTLARVPMAGLKGVWLEVQLRAQIGDSGAFFMTIKKPDGKAVISIDEKGLDLWRQGQYIRPKWGIYRGKSTRLRTEEETVRFANFAITAGANPSSDCRDAR